MKTAEEIAEEYVRPLFELALEAWGNQEEVERYMASIRDAFLAGYEAAKESL